MSELPQRTHGPPSGSKKRAEQAKSAPILTGLIGASIQASGSPAIHMEEARASGLDYSYKLFDLETIEGGVLALPRLLDQVEREGYAGVNITYPCKQAVVPLLHALSPDAEALGAVNTVVFHKGRRTGHNTDCIGFHEGLTRGLPDATLDCVAVIGAGGGGAAVSYALLEKGARRVIVHDTDMARADTLAARMSKHFPLMQVVSTADLAAAARVCDGVVNCTPVGMTKYPGTPIASELIEARHWVGDIVYFPLETELLRLARARGCSTLDGGGMAVFQAAEAFRLFCGHTPDHARMLERFRAQALTPNEGPH
jgi:shikimate dehydrogenase